MCVLERFSENYAKVSAILQHINFTTLQQCELSFLRFIIYKMKAKSSPQLIRFFNRCLPIAFTQKMFVHVSDRYFFHQIVANLPRMRLE